MKGFSNSSKSSFSKDLVYSVSLFDVPDLFEANKIFEGHHKLVPLIQIHVDGSLAKIDGQ